MADPIVVKRLVRNFRYRLTYIKVFESFLQPEPHPEVASLLHALIDAEQSAVVRLAEYLKTLSIATEDLPLVKRLQDHASSRGGVRSRLHFARYGLAKAVSWYNAQLMDEQMTADPQLRRLLIQLGEMEAASLWRTRTAMAMMGIGEEDEPGTSRGTSRREPARAKQPRSRQTVTLRHANRGSRPEPFRRYQRRRR